MMNNLKYIIESLLFVTAEPLTIERIRKIILSAHTDEIRSALEALAEEYETRKGGFYLHEVAGGFQIRTRPEYTQWIKRLIQPRQPRLSKAALETLAIIAYKQPIMRSDIEHLRGVDSEGILRTLLERKLIRILGRKELPGRPMIYGTTRYFLEVFDLKDLTDLPTPEEIKELGTVASDQIAPPSEAAGPEKPPAANMTKMDNGQTSKTLESKGNQLVFSKFPGASDQKSGKNT